MRLHEVITFTKRTYIKYVYIRVHYVGPFTLGVYILYLTCIKKARGIQNPRVWG